MTPQQSMARKLYVTQANFIIRNAARCGEDLAERFALELARTQTSIPTVALESLLPAYCKAEGCSGGPGECPNGDACPAAPIRVEIEKHVEAYKKVLVLFGKEHLLTEERKTEKT